jgi:hypothetical protein
MATLEITFTGLFLFVRQGYTLHVLLPATGGVGQVHRHSARLEASTGGPIYSFPERGAVRLSGINPISCDDVEVPSQAFDLERITGKRLDLDQLGGQPTNQVYLRLELPLPSDALRPGPQAAWRFGTDPQDHMLSHKMVYTLRGQALPDLTFTQRRFITNQVVQTVKFPVQGQPLRLNFSHLSYQPICPHQHYEATHFNAYYALYTNSVTKRNPKLAYQPTEPCIFELKRDEPLTLKEWYDASTFTCMVAQVKPQ